MDNFVRTTITWVAGLVIVICAIAGCTAHINRIDDESMTEMVKYGADPISARCAIKDISSSACAIASTKIKLAE